VSLKLVNTATIGCKSRDLRLMSLRSI